jgi:predicted 2-oxoglutarate/Fe(II)-dependent dioxygenase YbiX/peroxiredoxin
VTEYLQLAPGDPAPWFHQRTAGNPRYAFDTAAGRYIVLCFLGRATLPQAQAALAAVRARPDLFDDSTASFFGITCDPADETTGRLRDHYPGYRHFWDFDCRVSRLYSAAPADAGPAGQNIPYRCLWYVLDPTLRILHVLPFAQDGGDAAAVIAFLEKLPPPARFAGPELQAPVLFLPNVFEPQLCERLMAYYTEHGGRESGFMREVDGKTVMITDHAHKRRRDCEITDQALRATIQARVKRRIVPEIAKVHQFHVTRMERYIVGRYAADEEGHFRAHRDNTTKGTAHRRFAVSINLNAGFEGGSLCFPEYGPRQYTPPPGGAVVFSCSLLHAVSRVTRGERYAFLPFLYDDAAAALREQNNRFLSEEVGAYVMAPPETEKA